MEHTPPRRSGDATYDFLASQMDNEGRAPRATYLGCASRGVGAGAGAASSLAVTRQAIIYTGRAS